MAEAIPNGENSVARKIVQSMPPTKIDWMVHANKLHLTYEEWQRVFDDTKKKFVTRMYPSLFAEKLNELAGIQCDVKASGPYVSAKRFKIRMKCSQADCGRRQYLFTAIHNNKPIGDDGIDFKVEYFSSQPQTITSNKPIQHQLMANGLYEEASIYMKPKAKFIVAAANGMLLSNIHYNSVNGLLNRSLMSFVLSIFSCIRKDIQFEFLKTDHLLGGTVAADTHLLRVTKSIVVGLHLSDANGVLVILNTKTKTFCYLNTFESTPICSNYFEKFKIFVTQHNKKYPQVALPTEGWRRIFISKHPINEQKIIDNNSLIIIKYAKDITEFNKILPDFDLKQFRKDLAVFILKKSDDMTQLCLMCGLIANSNEKMTKCERCDRVYHPKCVFFSTIENNCILCQ